MMTSEDELTDLKAQSPCLLEHRYLLPVSKIVSMFKGLTRSTLFQEPPDAPSPTSVSRQE